MQSVPLAADLRLIEMIKRFPPLVSTCSAPGRREYVWDQDAHMQAPLQLRVGSSIRPELIRPPHDVPHLHVLEWIRSDLERIYRWCARGRSQRELAGLAVALQETVQDLYSRLGKPSLAGEAYAGEREFETIVPSGRFLDLRNARDGTVYSLLQGSLDDTAIDAFGNGQCHGLALCGWMAADGKLPLVAVTMPGFDRLQSHFAMQNLGVARYLHLLLRHPSSGQLIDVMGRRAEDDVKTEWRNRSDVVRSSWATSPADREPELVPVTKEQIDWFLRCSPADEFVWQPPRLDVCVHFVLPLFEKADVLEELGNPEIGDVIRRVSGHTHVDFKATSELPSL